jgi:hypothetical protein
MGKFQSARRTVSLGWLHLMVSRHCHAAVSPSCFDARGNPSKTEITRRILVPWAVYLVRILRRAAPDDIGGASDGRIARPVTCVHR